MTAQKLSAYLDTAALQSISLQARRLNELQQIYTAIAPAELMASSRVGYLKAGALIIVADNGAVAAKLRQLTPRLFAQFRKRRGEITGIRVEVQADAMRDDNVLSKNAKLTAAGAGHLARFAQSLADSPLKSTLEELVKRRTGR